MNKFAGAAAVVFALTAAHSTGHHQGDEHFQVLEFAAYKLGRADASDLSWEFHERMRPALQPAVAWVVYRMVSGLGLNDPFLIAALLRLLSGGLSLWLMVRVYARWKPRVAFGKAWVFPAFVFLHWCAFYVGVRFSSENWGGLCAVAGLLAFPLGGNERRNFLPSGGHSAWLAGVFFGLAFLFRYQMALFIGGFYLWWLVYERRAWRPMLRSVAAALATLAVCYPLTFWLYGEWVLPAWNYFSANLVEGRAAAYGTRPVWAYLELVTLRGIPPLGILYTGGTLVYLYTYRRDPVAWSVGVFVLVHSLIGRKDVRFLYPLTPLLPVLVAGAWMALRERVRRDRNWIAWAGYTCAVINGVLLVWVATRPAASEIGPARFAYTYSEGPLGLCGPDADIIKAEGATARFYLRGGQRILPDCGTCGEGQCLYLVRTRDAPEPPPGASLVYTDRPEALSGLLPAGVLDGQKWWYIYALP